MQQLTHFDFLWLTIAIMGNQVIGSVSSLIYSNQTQEMQYCVKHFDYRERGQNIYFCCNMLEI